MGEGNKVLCDRISSTFRAVRDVPVVGRRMVCSYSYCLEAGWGGYLGSVGLEVLVFLLH